MELNSSSQTSLEVLFTQESTTYTTCDYLSLAAGGAADPTVEFCGEETVCARETKKRRLNAHYCSSSSSSETSESSLSSSSDEGDVAGEESHVSNRERQLVWREKICEWMYNVVDHFDTDREVVSIAMHYVDRVSAQYAIESPFSGSFKNHYQLVAMTCLYVAMKLFEHRYVVVPGSSSSMETILRLGRGQYTLKDMERAELELLSRLEFFVHPPTPQVFVDQFVSQVESDSDAVKDLATFMVELTVVDYFFVPYRPSEVALGALMCAIDFIQAHTETSVGAGFREHIMLLQTEHTLNCRDRIAQIHAKATGLELPNSTGKCDDRTSSPVSVADFHVGV